MSTEKVQLRTQLRETFWTNVLQQISKFTLSKGEIGDMHHLWQICKQWLLPNPVKKIFIKKGVITKDTEVN